MNGAVPTWKLYWCVLTERNSCLWLPPGDMAVRVLLECVSFLGRWSYITTGTLSAYQSRGGGRGAAAPRNCWAGQIKSVDGFVPFRLSYFDCSNLHLFSIFTREDTDPPPPYKARAFDSCDNAAPSPLPPPSSWQKNLLRPCLLASKKTCNVPVPWRLESHKL